MAVSARFPERNFLAPVGLGGIAAGCPDLDCSRRPDHAPPPRSAAAASRIQSSAVLTPADRQSASSHHPIGGAAACARGGHHTRLEHARTGVYAGVVDRVVAALVRDARHRSQRLHHLHLSSERRPRLCKFLYSGAVNSSGFQPTPTPSRKRPPHKTLSRRPASLHEDGLSLRQYQHAGGKSEVSGARGQITQAQTNGSWNISSAIAARPSASGLRSLGCRPTRGQRP